VLLSETGGHGLYAAFVGERWRPKGGRFYPNGPGAVAPTSLLWIDADGARGALAVVRSLSEIAGFVDTRRARFNDLPRGATPPWFWRGGGAGPGAIIRDPAALYRAMLRSRPGAPESQNRE